MFVIENPGGYVCAVFQDGKTLEQYLSRHSDALKDCALTSLPLREYPLFVFRSARGELSYHGSEKAIPRPLLQAGGTLFTVRADFIPSRPSGSEMHRLESRVIEAGQGNWMARLTRVFLGR